MTAHDLANEIITWLAPHATRVEVAGSVRRGKLDPKDIEIVLIPLDTFHEFTDALVGAPTFFAPPLPSGAVGRCRKDAAAPRWGKSYRRLIVDNTVVEIFTATPATWGYIYWLRTGPGDANTYIMQNRRRFNLPFIARDGEILNLDGAPVPVPDEQTMFTLMRLPYLDPHQRTLAAYQAHLEKLTPPTPPPAPTTPPKDNGAAPAQTTYLGWNIYHDPVTLDCTVTPTEYTPPPPAAALWHEVKSHRFRDEAGIHRTYTYQQAITPRLLVNRIRNARPDVPPAAAAWLASWMPTLIVQPQIALERAA